MSLSQWEHFFKPEVRNSGLAIVRKNKISIRQPSDTEINSITPGASSFRTTLKCTHVASPMILANCNCSHGQKGLLCKHIWAIIVIAIEKNSDFFEGKTELISAGASSEQIQHKQKSIKKADPETKAKQAEYRKQQYQKQKLRLKELKNSKNPKLASETFPDDVEEALEYFLKNGFPLRDSLTKADVAAAMKKLARVFHPDLGGSHEEILELNEYSEILTRFARS